MRRVLAAALLATGCGIIAPVRHHTPAGVEVVYNGDYRLPREKVREIDERYAAVLECIPPERRCMKGPPTVEIVGGNCDSFVSQGVRVRGETFGAWRVRVPGSLGALGHEMTHLVACEASHARDSLTRTCGDVIDGTFRRLYPPRKCKGDP